VNHPTIMAISLLTAVLLCCAWWLLTALNYWRNGDPRAPKVADAAIAASIAIGAALSIAVLLANAPSH
jgi:hypothetical protein